MTRMPRPARASGTGRSPTSPPTSLRARRAVPGRTDFGEPGFGGAAPPPGHGPHRYIFTVFAVDTDRLEVTPDNSGAVFGFNLHFHTLAKASITATYENAG
jgi:Raf kinase inhibitor-like YbhB/YbcL family protein